MFFTTFVTHTSLYIKIWCNIPFNATTKFISVTINDRSLTVQYPIWITELFLFNVCPVLHINTSFRIKHFKVFLISVPVLTSWEQISSSQRIEQITCSSLVLDILIYKFSIEIYMNIFQYIKANLRAQVVATIIIRRSYTLRIYISI